MWIAQLVEGPLHGETTPIIEAYFRLHMPIPRERGWPCEFAIYQLDRKEVRDFTHRYRFQAVRRASYEEKLLFDGGRSTWACCTIEGCLRVPVTRTAAGEDRCDEHAVAPSGKVLSEDQPRELGSSGAVVCSTDATGARRDAA